MATIKNVIPGPPIGPPPLAPTTRPRKVLGAVTFVIAVLAALLAVFPATLAWGTLLCIIVIVPAILSVALLRKKHGYFRIHLTGNVTGPSTAGSGTAGTRSGTAGSGAAGSAHRNS